MAIQSMGKDYGNVRKIMENAWHERSWVGNTNDPNAHEHKSTEFGWSTMPGGSKKQKEAHAQGVPWRLNAWTCSEGRLFYEMHVEPLLPAAWRALERRFPRTCKRMLESVPPEYRLAETAFTKITIALNNPTPVHFDDNNFGLTCAHIHGSFEQSVFLT